jgi:hypothetical protein
MRFSRFSGLDNLNPPESLRKDGLTVASNIDIADDGSVSVRSGIQGVLTDTVESSAPQGCHSLWGDGDGLMLFRTQSDLLRLDEAGNTALVKGQLSGDAAMSYVKFGQRVYFCDGQNTGWTDGTQGYEWGLPIAPAITTRASAGGRLPRGTYLWATAWLSDDGEESGASAVQSIELNGQQGLLFEDWPSAQFLGIRPGVRLVLYISAPNGTTLYRATVLPVLTLTPFVFDGDGLARGIELATLGLSPPPKGNYVISHAARLWMAQDSFVFYSRPFYPEHFDLVRQWMALPDPVTLLASLADGLLIGTSKQIYRLTGLDPETAQLVQLAPYGAVPGCACEVDGALIGDGIPGKVSMFLSKQGVCVAGGEGFFRNLTQGHYWPTDEQQGRALYWPRESLHQFVFVTQ